MHSTSLPLFLLPASNAVNLSETNSTYCDTKAVIILSPAASSSSPINASSHSFITASPIFNTSTLVPLTFHNATGPSSKVTAAPKQLTRHRPIAPNPNPATSLAPPALPSPATMAPARSASNEFKKVRKKRAPKQRTPTKTLRQLANDPPPALDNTQCSAAPLSTNLASTRKRKLEPSSTKQSDEPVDLVKPKRKRRSKKEILDATEPSQSEEAQSKRKRRQRKSGNDEPSLIGECETKEKKMYICIIKEKKYYIMPGVILADVKVI